VPQNLVALDFAIDVFYVTRFSGIQKTCQAFVKFKLLQIFYTMHFSTLWNWYCTLLS